MQSRVRILPGQSLTVAAACTITVSDTDVFSSDTSPSAAAAELIIDGVAAEVVLDQPALSDEHSVQVLVVDE